jgi:hypothetical protein
MPSADSCATWRSRLLPRGAVTETAASFDSYIREAQIRAGTRTVHAGVRHDGSLVWLSARLVTVIFVLDERRTLVRTAIFSHNEI